MSFEVSLLVVLLCTAFVPVLARLWGIKVRGRTAVIGLVALWLSLTGVIVAAALCTDYQPPDSAKHRPRELPTDGYVGSDTCRSCHPHNHATWHASYHRTMTQVATPDSVIGEFDDVRLANGEVQIRLEREDDQFMVDLTIQNEGHMGRFPIVMTTGSHHMQAYWFFTEEGSRILHLLPFVYLKTEQRWIPRASAFLEQPSGDESPAHRTWRTSKGLWNYVCIKCHATHGRFLPSYVDGTASFDSIGSLDTQAVEFGISCEACHGPGSEHVRANRNPLHRYTNHLSDKPDSTILNPADLPHELSSQVCGQCHARFSFQHENAFTKWTEQGYDYRPGGDLANSTIRIMMRSGSNSNPNDQPADPHTFWSDGMVRVSGAEYLGLIESPCYQSEDARHAKMSCFSCHQMHRERNDPRTGEEWANDQLGIGMDGNGACLQCHGQFEDAGRVAAHTHHAAGSSGSLCYNCHMPHTTYGLLKAIRSHQVDSPTVQASLETGRPNACNQCHLDKTLGWTADHLFDWYRTPKPNLSDDEQEIAASVLWLLRGDAGQRALMAWSYGWEDAKQVSGTHWQTPYLAQLLEDPYDAVRFISERSLRRLPGFSDFRYEFMGPLDDRSIARQRALAIWEETDRPTNPANDRCILLDNQGHIMRETFDRLLDDRDDRPADLYE